MAKEMANVRLAARADALGAGPVTVGARTVAVLPDEAAQRRGWYEPNAHELIALYRGRFLMIVGNKGVK
jgi:hypothetical protein